MHGPLLLLAAYVFEGEPWLRSDLVSSEAGPHASGARAKSFEPAGATEGPGLPIVPERLTTPALRPAPPQPGGFERARTPTTLFINFDGATLRSGCGNDAQRDCSALIDTFGGYVGPFLGLTVQKMGIIQAVRKDLADFGVRVVVERPPEGTDYTMVLYGQLGDQSFAGIAPYIDCGDLWGGDTSFAQGYGTSNAGSSVILQEAAHTWGLEHVDGPHDILNPFMDPVASPTFQDECHRIVADTNLDPVAGVCHAVHSRFCEVGFQNSWQEMRYLFGPPVPDTKPPRVTILSPAEGSEHALPVTLPLVVQIDDDNHPQAYSFSLTNGAKKLFSSRTSGIQRRTAIAALTNPPAGAYDLAIELSDEAGNPTTARVRFTVHPEGWHPDGHDADTHSDTQASPEAPSEGGCRLRPSFATASPSRHRPSPPNVGASPLLFELGLGLACLLLRRRRDPAFLAGSAQGRSGRPCETRLA